MYSSPFPATETGSSSLHHCSPCACRSISSTVWASQLRMQWNLDLCPKPDGKFSLPCHQFAGFPSLERVQPSTWNSSLEISKLYDISDGPFPSCFPLFLCSFVEEIGPEMRSGICALTTIFPESLHLYCFFFFNVSLIFRIIHKHSISFTFYNVNI